MVERIILFTCVKIICTFANYVLYIKGPTLKCLWLLSEGQKENNVDSFNHLKRSLTCRRKRGNLITEEWCTLLSDEPQIRCRYLWRVSGGSQGESLTCQNCTHVISLPFPAQRLGVATQAPCTVAAALCPPHAEDTQAKAGVGVGSGANIPFILPLEPHGTTLHSVSCMHL